VLGGVEWRQVNPNSNSTRRHVGIHPPPPAGTCPAKGARCPRVRELCFRRVWGWAAAAERIRRPSLGRRAGGGWVGGGPATEEKGGEEGEGAGGSNGENGCESGCENGGGEGGEEGTKGGEGRAGEGFTPLTQSQNTYRVTLAGLTRRNLTRDRTQTFPSLSFHPPLLGLGGRARCVFPRVSAAVAIAAWLGRALAVGVRKPLGGLDV